MTPEALAALHARASGPDRPWSAAEFASLLDHPGAVLIDGGATFALGRVAAGEAELLMIATDPPERRRGLGRAALDAFEDRAVARGATRAVLEVAEDNAAARALYAAQGYEAVGRRQGYYARGPGRAPVAALVLARDLP